MPENLLIGVASAIYDPVTTTDELIPSGETSSYRSNPKKLATFALSRKDPQYVGRAERIQALELERRNLLNSGDELTNHQEELAEFLGGRDLRTWGIGSAVFALQPGDGSAREQAASCQRVLGGVANITSDYATKRYRSNVINWGMLPFTLDNAESFGIAPGDRISVPNIRKALIDGDTEVAAELIQGDKVTKITLKLPGITKDERDVILAGSLINYYKTGGNS